MVMHNPKNGHILTSEEHLNYVIDQISNTSFMINHCITNNPDIFTNTELAFIEMITNWGDEWISGNRDISRTTCLVGNAMEMLESTYQYIKHHHTEHEHGMSLNMAVYIDLCSMIISTLNFANIHLMTNNHNSLINMIQFINEDIPNA